MWCRTWSRVQVRLQEDCQSQALVVLRIRKVRRRRQQPEMAQSLMYGTPSRECGEVSRPSGRATPDPYGRWRVQSRSYSSDGLVLLLGKKEAWTPLPWRALEEIPELLRGRGWIPIGSTYATEAVEGTLDGHLKKYLARATAGWVAVVLENAGVIEIDRSRPARVKLSHGW